MKKNRYSFQKILSTVVLLAILLSVSLAVGLQSQAVYAASTINVNTTIDENGAGGGCSLREAIISANTNTSFGGCTDSGGGGPFTINVPAGVYALTIGELQTGTLPGANISIIGSGSASTIIHQFNLNARVFDLDPSVVGNVSVSISGVTIENGAAQAFGGGAILGGGSGDSLILTNAVIRNNTCSGFFSGAGISWSPAGNVTITNTTFLNNVCASGAAGAVLYTTGNGSTLNISGSTFTGNLAGATGSAGGALMLGGNAGSPVFNINSSIFSGNQAVNVAGIGGAIYVGGGTLNLGNTAANRFLGNTAGITSSGGLGVRGGTANAANNWWGCNGGPGSGSGCDKADYSGGVLIFTPWIVLSNAASPNPIQVNQTTTLTADFLHNSATGALTTGQIGVLLGLPVSWEAANGSISGAQTNIQANGTATATFTASAAGAGSGTATVQNGAGIASITINKGDTTTSLFADTPDPSVTGQPVTVNFSVASLVGSVPTAPAGNVTVSDGTVSCTASIAAGQCTLTFSSSGVKSLTATYAGDANFNESTSSPAVSHTVNPANTTTTISADSPDPSAAGQAVTVNFNVAAVGPGSGTPTGNVTVSDGVDSCTGTIASGTCSLTLTTGGSRTLTATYAGDTTFNGSTLAGEPHTVSGGSTTTTTITADTPDPSVVGQAVTIQFSVAPTTGTDTPTGNVTVSDGTISCTASVAAGQCSLTFSSAGARSLTAIYAGDSPFQTSTSAIESHQVNKADTTTTITADTPDPSLVNQAVAVTYDVAVNAPGAGTPTGTVTVGDGIDSCTGNAPAGTCFVTLTTAGPRLLAAIYSGDRYFDSSTSASIAHLVTLPDNTPPDTTITATPPNLSTSTNASFSFSGTDDAGGSGVASFECKLDGGSFAACARSKSYTGLSLGSHTFEVRAIDVAGNVDPTPAAYTWSIKAVTTLLYNGGQIVNVDSLFQPAAKLSSAAAACVSGQSISFALDRSPLTGMGEAYALGAATTHSSGQATLGALNTTGWQDGIYTITASFAGTANCLSSTDQATLTVASPGNSATGGGWYTLPGSGRINFGFTVRKVESKCLSSCAYKGQVLLINNGKWRLKGLLNAYSKLATGQGASSGVGDLYWWNSSLNGGLGDWALAQAGAGFTINFYDSGKSGKSSTDTLGIRIVYSPVAPQPGTLPNSPPQLLKGGDIKVQ